MVKQLKHENIVQLLCGSRRGFFFFFFFLLVRLLSPSSCDSALLWLALDRFLLPFVVSDFTYPLLGSKPRNQTKNLMVFCYAGRAVSDASVLGQISDPPLSPKARGGPPLSVVCESGFRSLSSSGLLPSVSLGVCFLVYTWSLFFPRLPLTIALLSSLPNSSRRQITEYMPHTLKAIQQSNAQLNFSTFLKISSGIRTQEILAEETQSRTLHNLNRFSGRLEIPAAASHCNPRRCRASLVFFFAFFFFPYRFVLS